MSLAPSDKTVVRLNLDDESRPAERADVLGTSDIGAHGCFVWNEDGGCRYAFDLHFDPLQKNNVLKIDE